VPDADGRWRLIVVAARGEVEEIPGLPEATFLRREAAEAEDHRPECSAGSDVRNPTPPATCQSEHPRVVSPNYPCPLVLCSGHASCVLLARMVGSESRNRRQHPRTRVSWPVVVETGTHHYPCELTDISNRGAKVMTREQLETGSVVRLQIVAPDGAPLRVGAVVRRIDADGVAFSFARSIYHRFIHVA
jgi:hypothetical protein